jgi:hypothetical protein
MIINTPFSLSKPLVLVRILLILHPISLWPNLLTYP